MNQRLLNEYYDCCEYCAQRAMERMRMEIRETEIDGKKFASFVTLKPEPSRLEIAAMILDPDCIPYKGELFEKHLNDEVVRAITIADALIKANREMP